MSAHITDERQGAAEPWNTDNDRILERLALNEDNDMPWAELRRIIRQKLAHAVELLIRRQEKADAIARQESEEEREDANSSDLSEDTPAPATEASSRKRGRFESSSKPDVRIEAAIDSTESTTNGGHKDEDNDEIMGEEITDNALVAESDCAMAVSEVSPEPTSSSPVGNGQGPEGVAANSAEANGDNTAIALETPNGHHGLQAEGESEEPKEDAPREQATGGPADSVREMRDLEERIGYCLHTFDEAPFTIQRIAELLMWPERHYRSVIKFLRAVERVVYVTSTVDEFPLTVDRSAAEQQVDMPIESDGDARSASASLFSFLVVAQDEQSTDVSANVQTKAITMRPPSTSYAKAVESKSSPGSSTLTMMPPPPGAGGAPPLDASDTGILHIAPMSAENEDTLRAKIGSTIDTAGIPVCIDELDGRSGKVAVRPVHITPSTVETAWTGERMTRETKE
ncbi:hypothetical protein GGH94_003672 [Coemansia aciculifera]|uniref:PPP4R2-domain-containing protein n=1 Tax=Coemansia aciculifera TaxID=417176 RepID=A0A9W8IQQ7_9FUNG|nr:hypothetical protein GGH94_003672 [Coemansia aciculifera]